MPDSLAPEKSSLADKLIGLTLGQYTLVERIGHGGMATVYKARDLKRQGGIVALKVLAPQLAVDPTFQARFLREAQLLSDLRHPHIVPVLDYGESEGYMYLVMPYMQVGGLSDRLQGGPLSVKEGARIFTQIAAALQYAHDRGIVHRDVKPSNVLIDDQGNAWLSDFGFAYISDASLSLTGSALIGTPAYMAPELVKGAGASPLSDQYSLGVLLYQMSTGYLPYDAETPMGMAIKHATEPLPRPRLVNPNLPDAVEGVIIRVLSKDPARRFRSVAEFFRAFRTALKVSIDLQSGVLKPGARGKEPITSPVEELPEVPHEPRRLRRAWVGALALLLLACPFSVWLLTSYLPGSSAQGQPVAMALSEQDLNATLQAMASQLAPPEGTEVEPGWVETQVGLILTETAQAGGGPLVEWSATPSSGGEMGSPTPTEEVSLPNTGTLVPTATPPPGFIPSATSVYIPGATSTPSHTPAVSNTPGPTSPPGSTATPTPTVTLTSTVTQTTVPSSTPSVTPTNTLPPATPTNTSPPPPTATEDICSQLSFGSLGQQKRAVFWSFTNGSGTSVTISTLRLTWSGDDTNTVVRIKVEDVLVWSGSQGSPASVSGVGESVAAGTSKTVRFEFSSDTEGSSYSVRLTTTNSCTVSK